MPFRVVVLILVTVFTEALLLMTFHGFLAHWGPQSWRRGVYWLCSRWKPSLQPKPTHIHTRCLQATTACIRCQAKPPSVLLDVKPLTTFWAGNFLCHTSFCTYSFNFAGRMLNSVYSFFHRTLYSTDSDNKTFIVLEKVTEAAVIGFNSVRRTNHVLQARWRLLTCTMSRIEARKAW